MRSDEDDVERDFQTRDILRELGDIKAILARLERLMERIALGIGVSISG